MYVCMYVCVCAHHITCKEMRMLLVDLGYLPVGGFILSGEHGNLEIIGDIDRSAVSSSSVTINRPALSLRVYHD